MAARKALAWKVEFCVGFCFQLFLFKTQRILCKAVLLWKCNDCGLDAEPVLEREEGRKLLCQTRLICSDSHLKCCSQHRYGST